MRLATDRLAKTMTGPVREGRREMPFLREGMRAGQELRA
jgi:hypothetical protein